MADSQGSTRSATCPFEVRAFIDDVLVATTRAALRIERSGAAPLLCFPLSDVREKPASSGLLLDAPAGYMAFNPDNARVRVVLVDGAATEHERDHTLKRFPNWGDAADLIDLLNVRRDGERRYVSSVFHSGLNMHRGVVEGSQMLGQSIVAAGRHAPQRRPVFASMVFARAANTVEPLRLELDELSSGKSFTTLSVRVAQNDTLCASGLLLLDATAPDVVRHAVSAPQTKGPYASVPYDMSVTGRDIRFVDAAYNNDPDAPVGPPLLDAWVRFRDVPADPPLHAALLAQFTGHASIAAALRPHAGIGQNQAHKTLSTAINAIQISFHANVRADRWMLYRHHSTFAGDGMTHSECRVHDIDGALLASFSVEAMVRRFAPDRRIDARTTL